MLRLALRTLPLGTAYAVWTGIGTVGAAFLGMVLFDEPSDVTWAKGRHTIKTGFEFRHHNFPVRGWGVGGTAGNFNFERNPSFSPSTIATGT